MEKSGLRPFFQTVAAFPPAKGATNGNPAGRLLPAASCHIAALSNDYKV
jgi:hypothetical protein